MVVETIAKLLNICLPDNIKQELIGDLYEFHHNLFLSNKTKIYRNMVTLWRTLLILRIGIDITIDEKKELIKKAKYKKIPRGIIPLLIIPILIIRLMCANTSFSFLSDDYNSSFPQSPISHLVLVNGS